MSWEKFLEDHTDQNEKELVESVLGKFGPLPLPVTGPFSRLMSLLHFLIMQINPFAHAGMVHAFSSEGAGPNCTFVPLFLRVDQP